MESLPVASDTPRKGTYKLLKKAIFARVSVSVFPNHGSADEVINATYAELAGWQSPDLRADARSDPDWIQGAIVGVEKAIILMRTHSPVILPVLVVLDEVLGAIVDTTPNAVEVAATMAVLHAMNLDADAAIGFDDASGEWKVTFATDDKDGR